MIISKKLYTNISHRLIKKYYDRSPFMKSKTRFFWDRGSSAPIFFVNKVLWIHKGIHFRKKIIEYYHMSTPLGSFTINRKPFSPPVKKNEFKKKKRNG